MLRAVVIDENLCEGCGICYSQFGCPAISRLLNGQARINVDLCNGNGSCLQVCPVQAIVRPAKDDTTADIARKYLNPDKVLIKVRCDEAAEVK